MTVAAIDADQANPVVGLDTLFSFGGYMSNPLRDFYDVSADGRILAARRAGIGGIGREVFIPHFGSYLEENLAR